MSAAILGTVALGGIAALDAVPVGQTMISQPLVTAAILGALWGDPHTALETGVVLQLLAASTLPVGARTPEDYASGGVVGTAVALGLAAQQPFAMAREASALLGVLAGLLTATGGVPLIKWQRRRNEGLARWCEAALRRGRGGALAEAQWAGIAFSFGVGVGYTALCLTLGLVALGGAVTHESLRLSRAWALAQPLWIGLGLAQLLSAFLQRRLARAAVFAFALAAAWLVLIVGGH
ncbi:MAG TPA: PTS sugar transporter subunit IIC [Candidatus Eisenbacteria bacterium]